MKLTPVYVITDSEGQAELEVDGTLEQTIDAALSAYGKHTQIVFSGDLEQMKLEKRHEDTRQERLSNPPQLPGFYEALAMRALDQHGTGKFWIAAEPGKGPNAGKEIPARPRTYSRDEVEGEFPMTEAGLKAAHEALREYFPKKGDFSRIIRNGKNAGKELFVGDTYESAAGMSKAFLVANAKTLKAAEGIAQREEGDDEGTEVTINNRIPPSLSKGLAFLPHALVKNTRYYPKWGGVPQLMGSFDPEGVSNVSWASVESAAKGRNKAGRGLRLEMGLTSGLGVCVGSSEACRTSCLIYAGQNQAVEHNNLIKGDRLRALLYQPKAFIRMMIDSMQKHVRATAKDGSVPYFRPNILSDIPWELLYPELWDARAYPDFENLSIYDYTKLAGRDTKSLGYLQSSRGADPMLDGALRYDLTYSFSGVNAEMLEHELARKMRVAIVFLRTLKSGSLLPSAKTGRPTFKAAESFNNMRFMGQKIIDGDEHDLRPLDPQGTVVGLRFKSLRGKTAGTRAEQIARAGEFVVGSAGGLPKYAERKRVRLETAGKTIKYVVEGFDDGHGNIIAAGTPLQEGVSQQALFDVG